MSELRCSNCGHRWVRHCVIHVIPCCPGKCPGPRKMDPPAGLPGVPRTPFR